MAREFDGASGVYEANRLTQTTNLAQGAMTFLAVIYPETIGEGNTGRIISSRGDGSANNNGGYIFFTDATASLGFQTLQAASGVVSHQRGADNACPLNQWNRVAFTYDDTGDQQGNIYVAGSEISYDTDTGAGGSVGTDATGVTQVGNDPLQSGGDARTFDGFMQEVALYNRVLTAGEIAAHAAGYSARFITYGRVFYLDLTRDVREYHGHTITPSGTHNVQPSPSMIYPSPQTNFFVPAAVGGAHPVNPLGHPLVGALGGPIG